MRCPGSIYGVSPWQWHSVQYSKSVQTIHNEKGNDQRIETIIPSVEENHCLIGKILRKHPIDLTSLEKNKLLFSNKLRKFHRKKGTNIFYDTLKNPDASTFALIFSAVL